MPKYLFTIIPLPSSLMAVGTFFFKFKKKLMTGPFPPPPLHGRKK